MRLEDLPEGIVGFARNAIATGRFSSVDDLLRAGMQALEFQQEATKHFRAAWEAGKLSLDEHGPQLTDDTEFEAFLDECVEDAMHHQT